MRSAFLFSLILVLLATTAWACGPFFPNMYFAVGGEADIVQMPEASFHSEVFRALGIPVVPEEEFYEEPDYGARTIEADTADLTEAFRAAGLTEDEVKTRIEAYTELRHSMRTADVDESAEETMEAVPAAGDDPAAEPAPAESDAAEPAEQGAPTINMGELAKVLKGAPKEFLLYAQGAALCRDGDYDGAIAKWNELLALPAGQRPARTMWAAYMIGRTQIDMDSAAAVKAFERTREFAQAGFKDPLGFAMESYGWQAFAEKASGDLVAAMHHYAEQLKSPDHFVRNAGEISLRWACSGAMDSKETLATLTKDEPCEKIVTAWIVSHPASTDEAKLWMSVLSEADSARPVASADLLAWAAYNLGEIDLARKWLEKPSAATPYGQWVRSKILMRDGKMDEAVAMLRDLAKSFPNSAEWAVMSYDEGLPSATSPGEEVKAELGVLLLGRKEYVESFDQLLRAGYWLDAAYVGEHVLTIEELQTYLTQHAEDPELAQPLGGGYWFAYIEDEGDSNATDHPVTRMQVARYTLGRRLARAGKWEQALPYFPPKEGEKAKALFTALQAAKPEEESVASQSLWQWFIGAKPERKVDRERAEKIVEAAELARENGMEILGTEVDPDWAAFGGEFELSGFSTRLHPSEEDAKPEFPGPALPASLLAVLTASDDERARVKSNGPEPNRRFHYRYYAADLMWRAAQWLPNNDVETMDVLYTGGMYLQSRDPDAANKFYRSLVWRNWNMPYAREADKLRWFPAEPPTEHPESTQDGDADSDAAPEMTQDDATQAPEEPGQDAAADASAAAAPDTAEPGK